MFIGWTIIMSFSLGIVKILKGALIIPAICFFVAYIISDKTIKKNVLIIPTFAVQLGHIFWILSGYMILLFTQLIEVNDYQNYIIFYLVLTIIQFSLLLWLLFKELKVIPFILLLLINIGHAVILGYSMSLTNSASEQEITFQLLHMLIRLVSVGTLIYYFFEQKKGLKKMGEYS